MLKATILTPKMMTANETIVFDAFTNTNSNTSYDTGELIINTPGLYEIHVNMTVTGATVGDAVLQGYDNGVLVPELVASGTSAISTDKISLNIHDIIKVKSAIGEKVRLTFKMPTTLMVNYALVTITKVR